MRPFRYHAFVCTQHKPEGVPSCTANGCQAVLESLQREVIAAGLDNVVQITTSGSLGLCDRGPNMVVYPDGVWYSGVRPEDCREIVEQHFKNGHPVARLANTDEAALHQEIVTWRARGRAARQMQAVAGASVDEINALARGFMESRVVLTAIELNVFTAIRDGATAAQAAQKLGTDPRATESFLNALVAMKLATKNDGTFRPTPTTARYLIDDSPESIRLAMMHVVNLWDRWDTLTDALRAGTAVYSGERREEWTESFIAAMDRNARTRAPQVAKALDLSSVRRVLDVGGGSGAYSIAFARENPDLHAVVFDLAPVVEIAQRHIAAANLADRVHTQVGDFHVNSLGEGYDMVFLSAILHMNSPEENIALLRKAYAALVPRGRVVIQDFILTDDKTAPRSGALFALNMLVGTKGGSAYSGAEYRSWLAEVGFNEIRTLDVPGSPGLVVGVRL